jgi:hypothetical protein
MIDGLLAAYWQAERWRIDQVNHFIIGCPDPHPPMACERGPARLFISLWKLAFAIKNDFQKIFTTRILDLMFRNCFGAAPHNPPETPFFSCTL